MDELRVRLARMKLPLPLEPMIYRSLCAETPELRHDYLLTAWETTTKILAASLWAVCTRLGKSSPEWNDACATLVRPSFGQWMALVRVGRTLLRSCKQPEALALGSVVEGFEKPLHELEGARALAERIKAVPNRKLSVQGNTLGALLQSLPAYRNAGAHGVLESAFRRASVEPLLGALLDLLEHCPPLGSYELGIVQKLERGEGEDQFLVEQVLLHGSHALLQTHTVERACWDRLVRGRPYLLARGLEHLPLFPLAAAEWQGSAWRFGWLEGKVHAPTMLYESGTVGSFQTSLPKPVYEALVGNKSQASTLELPAELLALDPYRGLLAYEDEHRGVYFGREEEVLEAHSRLQQQGGIVLCGASGSGKSSLLRAGLLPQVRAQALAQGKAFRSAVLVPGSKPLTSLRQALVALGSEPDATATVQWSRSVADCLPESLAAIPADGLLHLLRGLTARGDVVLLGVDQLEEAFTLGTDSQETKLFLTLLARVWAESKAASFALVATVRADLLAPFLEHETLRTHLDGRLFPLGKINSERLRRVVTEPLLGRGVALEAGLPELILSDVGDEAGTLALLSQVLTILWEERGRYGNKLTREGYEAAGRVSGALRLQAEAAQEECFQTPLGSYSPEARKDMVYAVLLELATVTEQGGFTRRRVTLESLAEALGCESGHVRLLLAPWARRRLLVLSKDNGSAARATTVELAHEALLTAWEPLTTRLRAQAAVLKLRQDLRSSVRAWEATGRRGELWSDASLRLAQAEEWVRTRQLRVTQAEGEFLRASRRRVRLRRWVERWVALGLVTLAVGLGIVRFQARETAQQAQRLARSALGARASILAGEPGSEHQALTLGLQAVTDSLTEGDEVMPLAVEGLVQAVLAQLARPHRGHSDFLRTTSFSPDGTRLVTSSWDQSARVWELQTGSVSAALLGHREAVRGASFSPDGTTLLTVSWDFTAKLWSARDGTLLQSLEHPGERVAFGLFSPDGSIVCTGSEAGLVRVWETSTGRLLHRLEGHRDRVLMGTMDRIDPTAPTGTRLVTAGADRTARLWQLRTGRLLQTFEGHEGTVRWAGFVTPNGDEVLTLATDGKVRLWSAASGALLRSFPVASATRYLALAPGRGAVLTAGNDALAYYWDLRTGQLLQRLEGHQGAVRAVAISPDGLRALTASADHTARIWELATGNTVHVLAGHGDVVYGADFSPDGSFVSTASWDRTARIWDLATGRAVLTLQGGAGLARNEDCKPGERPGQQGSERVVSGYAGRPGILQFRAHCGPVASVVFTPDGTRLVTAGLDGRIHRWSLADGHFLDSALHEGGISGLAYSHQGRWFATAGADYTLRVWNTDTLEPVTLRGHTAGVNQVQFSMDDRWLVSASADRTARVWELATQREALRLAGHGESVQGVAFSRDGRWVATASGDARSRLWDAHTGALVRSFEGHTDWVNDLVFSPDSQTLYTASDDHTVRAWSVPTASPVGKWEGHRGWVRSVSLARDGARLLSGSTDRTARLWDSKTGREILVLRGAGSRINHAELSPDGRRVALACEDGTVLVLPTETEAYVALACAYLRSEPSESLGTLEKVCKQILARP